LRRVREALVLQEAQMQRSREALRALERTLA
jgi:hypothetical protein